MSLHCSVAHGLISEHTLLRGHRGVPRAVYAPISSNRGPGDEKRQGLTSGHPRAARQQSGGRLAHNAQDPHAAISLCSAAGPHYDPLDGLHHEYSSQQRSRDRGCGRSHVHISGHSHVRSRRRWQQPRIGERSNIVTFRCIFSM